MLFDGRFADSRAKLFDVSGNGNGLDVLHFEPTVVAPVEELFYRARVCHPGVAVTDAGGEEFDERRLARSPWARIIAGSASSPARTSAGGGTISSVSRIGGLGIRREPSPFLAYI
jgi:hypothetical protein